MWFGVWHLLDVSLIRMLCFLLEEFVKRWLEQLDQSRKREPTLVSRNTSLPASGV